MNTPLVQRLDGLLGDLLSVVLGALLAWGIGAAWWRIQQRPKVRNG